MVRASPRSSGASPPDLRESLQRAFPHASQDTIRALDEAVDRVGFGRGHRLIAQGEPMEVVLVVEGRAALRRLSTEGKQMILLILGPGDVLPALSGRARDSPFDLVSMSDGLVACWKSDLVRHLAAANAGLALDLLDAAVAIGQVLAGGLDGSLFYDVRRRLSRALVWYSELAFGEQRPVITRSDLAALVGASREMTGRALRGLESEHVVTRVGRTGLRLLDAARLEEIAEHG